MAVFLGLSQREHGPVTDVLDLSKICFKTGLWKSTPSNPCRSLPDASSRCRHRAPGKLTRKY